MRHYRTSFLAAMALFLFLVSFAQGAPYLTLKRGMSGGDVRQLQAFLATMPDIYPNGNITGYFGSATERAMKRFQQKYGIQPLGIVGVQTQTKISQLRLSTSTSWENAKNNRSNSYGVSAYDNHLPSCEGSAYLTHTPTDFESFNTIYPLGNLNPQSGHVTPSDHIYFYLKTVGGVAYNNQGQPATTVPATIYAPGGVTILNIQKQTHTMNGITNSDYALTFSPCRELTFYYYHVTSVVQKIQDALTGKTGSGCGAHTYTLGNSSNSTCNYPVNIAFQSGEEMGTAGGQPGLFAFDFGSYDTRTPELGFLDKDRSLTGPRDEFLHTTCPLDYYANSSLKASLYAKVQNTKENKNGQPDCGGVMYDKAETIQGNWYLHDPVSNMIQPYEEILSILHLADDPATGAISVGGTITNGPILTKFTPRSAGTYNTEPSFVTADGKIYCYDDGRLDAHYLFQLIDTNHLQAEFQTGTCTSNPQFTKLTTYER